MLAGGHSLLPLMKLRLAAPTLLVDLRRVDELRGVSADGDAIRFGAMTRHHDVATGKYGLVAAAAATIADQQVRNMGTIGGTLAHGDPASDLPAVILAAEGSVTIRGSDGDREVAAADFFEDYLTTAVGDGEIVTSVSFPKLSGYGYGYQKFDRRAGGLGDGGRLRAGQEGRRRHDRGRAGRVDPHGLRRRCGRPRSRTRCAGSRSRASPPRPRTPPRAPSPRRTSTRRRTTSATWRGCCASAHSSQPAGG